MASSGQLQLYFGNVHFNCTEQQLRTFIGANTPSNVIPSKCQILMTPARRAARGHPAQPARPKGAAAVTIPQQFATEVIALNGAKLMGRNLTIEVSRNQGPRVQAAVSPRQSDSEHKEEKEQKELAHANIQAQAPNPSQAVLSMFSDQLTCEICYLEYTTSGPRMPKTLHGSHTFCNSCITQLPCDNNRVTCPLCNNDESHDPTAAVTNTLALRLIEVLADARKAEAVAQKPVPSASAPAPIVDVAPAAQSSAPSTSPAPAILSASPHSLAPVVPTSAPAVQPAAASPKPAKPASAKPAQAKPAAAQQASNQDVRLDAGLLKLSSRLHYPPFKKLPLLDGFTVDSEKYYAPQPDGAYAMYRHWAFIAEISRISPYPFRIGVHVKDRDGFEVPVFFYLDDGVQIRKEQLKPGATIVVRYAEAHQFSDGQIGLRIEDAKMFRVIPVPLLDLLGLDDRRNELIGWMERHGDSEVPCGHCRTKPAPKRCSSCRLVDYCTPECQRLHWPHHKTECKVWNALRDVHDWPAPPPASAAVRGFKTPLTWGPIRGNILKV